MIQWSIHKFGFWMNLILNESFESMIQWSIHKFRFWMNLFLNESFESMIQWSIKQGPPVQSDPWDTIRLKPKRAIRAWSFLWLRTEIEPEVVFDQEMCWTGLHQCPPLMSWHRPGLYSVQVVHFYLQRKLGYHLIQTYIPLIMVVVLSQVAFWINKESVPARTVAGMSGALDQTSLWEVFKLIYSNIGKYYWIYIKMSFISVIKSVFSASLLQSSVSHDLLKSW